MTRLIFLKLGGSIITHKDHTNVADLESIESITQGIKKALDLDPTLQLLIGHGSGSFGHHAARKYGTRNGVSSQEGWNGFAEVALRARELNQIVMDKLINGGLNAVSVSPFSGVQTENCQITSWDTSIISDCLYQRLIPVIYGDVILDHRLGGTILSTEELFAYLAPRLQPQKILLAGLEEGVWKDFPKNTELINEIHPHDFNLMPAGIKGSDSPDVTGGMYSKVQSMIALVKQIPSLEVQIFSAKTAGNVYKVLTGEQTGTIIRNPKG
ncbi:isopentenyl phosphate kinase family protein [bacterium]|nr:isopentenyl phosphate kinase family protein [bacterium]